MTSYERSAAEQEWLKQNCKGNRPWPYVLFVMSTSFALLGLAMRQYLAIFKWKVRHFINLQES